jgi:tetratricopeptide (TPR) repeat protein
MLRLWSCDQSALERTFESIQQQAGSALGPAQRARGPAHFADILAEAMSFPLNATSTEEVQQRQIEHMQNFMEEKWIHRPLQSLGGVAPVDAVGHAVLRRKVRGVVQFLQECAALGGHPYDFDRLRRKLGLAAARPETAATAASPSLDIGAMSAAELANLGPGDLSNEQAAEAFQAALKLDARELASKFAGHLVQRPHGADQPDRFPWYKHLVQQALDQGDSQAALNYLNEGEKDDCEHNEGKRRSDYELRRGQVFARHGDFDQAQDVFDRLIARQPAELRFFGSAAEALLSARQGSRARKYAEQGLAGARKQNNRDSEEYFKELVAASERQGS